LLGNLLAQRYLSARHSRFLEPTEYAIDHIAVDDCKSQRIPETLVYCQPGMLMTKTETGPQPVPECRRVHVFIELVIQISLYSALLQATDRAARLAAGFQQFMGGTCRHAINPTS
jgi:hypothetical protein